MPAWVAWMVQVPTVTSVTLAPETVQTAIEAEAKLTGRPEDALALSVNGAVPIGRSGSGANAMVWAAGCTTVAWIEAEDSTKLLSPLYDATTVCGPSGSALVLQAAVPFGCSATLPHNTCELSATNETVPVGVPRPGKGTVTVAVKVTDEPTSDGSGATANAVAVDAGFTVCPRRVVLPAFMPSPE